MGNITDIERMGREKPLVETETETSEILEKTKINYY